MTNVITCDPYDQIIVDNISPQVIRGHFPLLLLSAGLVQEQACQVQTAESSQAESPEHHDNGRGSEFGRDAAIVVVGAERDSIVADIDGRDLKHSGQHAAAAADDALGQLVVDARWGRGKERGKERSRSYN